MKKILLILIFMTAMLARGQDYVPLLDTNKVWNVFHNWVWEGFTYPYYLEISEFDTTRFIVKEIQHEQFIDEIGYLTEDTITKKVYFFNEYGDEILLYDFSLEEGDIFEYKLVTKVDSIQLLDGSYRRRIEFENGYLSDWIEGIGSIEGGILANYINYSKNFVEAWLLCYYENDMLLYMNDAYDTCNFSFILDDVETLNETIFNAYPNPFINSLHLSTNSPYLSNMVHITIFSIDGKVVFNSTEYLNTTIDLSLINPGIYLLVLKNNDFVNFKKITKI